MKKRFFCILSSSKSTPTPLRPSKSAKLERRNPTALKWIVNQLFGNGNKKEEGSQHNNSHDKSSNGNININTIEIDSATQEAFKYLDADGDGKISTSEVVNAFKRVGGGGAEAEAVGDVMDELGCLDLAEFNALINNINMNSEEWEKVALQAFELFDVGKEGRITPPALHRMMFRLGHNKTLDDCIAMIKPFDLDGDGVIDFHEFKLMIANSNSPPKSH